MRVAFALQMVVLLSGLPLRAVGPITGRGTPSSAPSPSPIPRPPISWGGHGSGLDGVRPVFPWRVPSAYSAFGLSGCLLAPSPVELYPLFASQYCGSLAYPPQTDVPQPSNVVVLPPAYVPTIAPELSSDSPDRSPISDHAPGPPATFHFSQTPSPSPIVLNEYPALVVFRSGGVYSVAKYWLKKNRFYFVTPWGETLYTPAGQVQHIYPAIKPGQ